MKNRILLSSLALLLAVACSERFPVGTQPTGLLSFESFSIERDDDVEVSVTKARVPLSEPQTLTIRQPTGEENVVEITSRGAVMRSANCHNQDCVHMGEVTVDNWETRVNGAFIICLPHQVTVELVVRE